MNTTPRSRWSGPARPFHPFGRGVLMLLSALLLDLPVPALAAPGDLDPSFDGDGKVLTDFRGFEFADAVVVQPDGKLVAAGARSVVSNNGVGDANIALARYNPDGGLDTSFGAGGHVVTDFGGLDTANALVLQPDGKLVAAGATRSSVVDSSDLILARYNLDGSLDTSFGIGGVVVVDRVCCPSGLVRQPDGKLVVNASSLVRLNPDGTLDRSFGRDGFASETIPFFFFGEALVLQPDGKLVRAGNVNDFIAACCGGDFALERFNPDGNPDRSFGDGGVVITDFGEPSRANALVLQPDGKLVTAGAIGTISFDQDFVLARYHADGSLDISFGSGGLVRTDFGSPFLGARALARQPDGKLLAAGGSFDQFSGTPPFVLARYQPDGSLDPSFGAGGTVRTDFGQPFVGAPALALQPGGEIVAAGASDASGDFDFALARYVTTDAPLAVPPKCGGRRATILGTPRKDTIRGTRGPDVILGSGGNDTIRGLEGNDTICGGPGRDTLIGNDGKDRLLGEGQNDKLFGDKGSDRLDGGSGRDVCRTGESARRCEGKPASSKPTSGERPKDPPKPPCPPVSNFPCS